MSIVSYRRLAPLAMIGLLGGLFGLQTVHPARADTVQVTIMNFAFQPATITVPAGTTVTWTNMDSAPHTSTSDNGVWNSPTLGTSQSYSFTFTQAGTFPYHCAVHPNMHGTVVVQGSPTSTSVPPPPPPPGPPAATPTPTATPVPPTATPTTPPPSTGKGQKQILTAQVKGKYVFKPAKVTIKVGTKVSWVNRTNAPHTVTSKTKSWKYNKKLNLRKSQSFVFRKVGTFKYYCIYHPGMVGTIVVKR